MSLLLFGQRAYTLLVMSGLFGPQFRLGWLKGTRGTHVCVRKGTVWTARGDDDYQLPMCIFVPQGKCGVLCPPVKGYSCNYFCGVNTSTAQQCD